MPSYEDLEARIIDTKECTVCGACITACPDSHIKLIENKPKRIKRTMDCVGCHTCYDACYMLRHDLIKDIEGSIMGWGRKESIGSYRRIVVARTRDTGIGRTCQNGGVVTTLLVYALDNGLIDGALVVGGDASAPATCVARTRDEIIRAAGTKYGVVPVLKELRAAVVDHGLSKVCVVGSPCHIQYEHTADDRDRRPRPAGRIRAAVSRPDHNPFVGTDDSPATDEVPLDLLRALK